MSVRQAITPSELHGRMNATYETVTYGAIPAGAMLGGLLGEAIGLQSTLLVASLGIESRWASWRPRSGTVPPPSRH